MLFRTTFPFLTIYWNFYLCDKEIQLEKSLIRFCEESFRLLTYNNDFYDIAKTNALIRVPMCDIFIAMNWNLEQHLTTCSEQWKQVYPNNVYQYPEFLSDKHDFSRSEDTKEQIPLKDMGNFDFESFCIH